MSVTADDLGVLGSLATAVGLLNADGDPNPGWFGDPALSLSTVLADAGQREALIEFVDEAMGGADREADASGATWLPVVTLDDPSLTVAVTVDDGSATHVLIGLGVSFATSAPAPVSRTSVSVPLFRAAKRGHSVTTPFVLGEPGGRLRFATRITVDDGPPIPGQARLGAIGLEVDAPTGATDSAATFGLVLEDFQLPGATAPRTLRVSAGSPEELDDAVLDLVLALVRAQAEAAGGPALGALAGLLGFADESVPDFPIEELAAQGAQALGTWLESILGTTESRHAWLDHAATLVEGTRVGDEIELTLGAVDATIRIGLRAETGPSGRLRLTATLGGDVGATSPRVQARSDVFRIDLGTGEALALPTLGLWASVGRHDGAGTRVLDVAAPTVARADRLRLGFALDADRRVTFVLAADGVRLGTRDYPTLDLTSPDAVMDAAGNAVEDVATELLGHLGGALGAVKVLLGLDPPPGHAAVPTITLGDLLRDPVSAVGGYWRTLLSAHGTAVPSLLEVVRDAVAEAGAAATPIRGTGTPADPWRIQVVGPVELEAHVDDDVLTAAIAAGTRVDTLGQRCTVVETRLAATVVALDLAERTAQLLPSVEGRLVTRERGVAPPQVRLVLDDDVLVTAEHVGVGLAWGAATGLSAQLEAPSLTLRVEDESIPIALPVVAPDGFVTFPAEGWDAVQALLGHLGGLFSGFIGDAVRLLGWRGRFEEDRPGLRLADLVDDPAAAFAAWLPELLISELGPEALGVLANLLSAAGPVSGAIAGSGHPDDPYRLALDLEPGVPELVVWFPPAGLAKRLVAAPESLRRWRPGDPALPAEALAHAIAAEGEVSAELRELGLGRDIAGGLAGLLARWTGGDGRIVPPAAAPAGVDVEQYAVAAGQLLGRLDLEDLLGRVATTVVYVDVGVDRWPDAPAGRRVDLTATGLAPEMFPAPLPSAGEWFVALGERAACRLASGDDDGTVGQAARLRRVLDALAPLGADLVLVGVGGAGHAARLAAQQQAAFSDVVTVGTPLGPVSLTALSTQPTADALRLLHRLLPPELPAGEDEDLALGRQLVAAMMELADLPDPSSELRPPATALPAPRAGLTTTAVFGAVDAEQVGRALTAVVAAGLASRARARAGTPLPEATGARAGVRLVLPTTTTGSLVVEGDALVTVAGYDRDGGLSTARELRVRLLLRDRLGWLASSPEHALRMVTADVTIPLSGDGAEQTAITLHDARAFGVDRERLVLGTTPDAVPLVPEARLLLSLAVQRLVADAANPVAAALTELLQQLGLVVAGGAVPDAFEQLVHDPAGLVAARVAAARTAFGETLDELLGPLGATIDLGDRTVRVSGGGASAGLFGWNGELTAGATGVTGHLTVGPDGPPGAAGALQLVLELAPFAASLRWRRPDEPVEEIPLWPAPDGEVIAGVLARAAPSLGAHVALELMRRADEEARPVIDAALDALGMLGGDPADELRPLRPLAGLLADPAGWLRSADSIAGQPTKAQALLDALRPLTGLGGGAGDPLPLADGVALSVRAAGADLSVELGVDTGGWTPIATPLGRLAAGLDAGLTISATGAPLTSLALHAGLTGGAADRNAVHVRLGSAGIELFLRPSSGPDIPLVPFAGLGGLAAAAARALPFLLDRLAAEPAPVGPAVAGVGDALALRSGAPPQFDGDALTAWAADPAAALATAVPSIVSAGLTTLAPLLDAVVPGNVTVTATATELTVGVGAVALAWNPSDGRVAVSTAGIDVPGVETLAFTLAVTDVGLDELSVALGPAAIDADTLTLRPFVSVAAGENPAGGRRVVVGLAVDGDHRFGARWLLDDGQFALIASDGPIAAPIDDPDPAAVALRAVEAVADLVAAVALGTAQVQELLDTPVGALKVRDLLRGVLLQDVANPTGLLDGVFDPSTALARAQRLFGNVAAVGLSLTHEGMEIRLLTDDGVIGVQLGLTQRTELVPGDVTLWLETDDSWIEDNPPGSGGLFVGLVPTGGGLRFEPSLTVNGVGLRVSKSSGPLLDFGVTLESIGLHTFARLGVGVTKGAGLQLAFSNLAVSAASANGGNSIASGILRDSGTEPPQPAFSPALAIQKHGSAPVHVTLRAGPGDGPWWIGIQKGFGPLYLEQVGLGVTMPQQRVERISLLMDGSVSLFGLTCAVDDLQITYLVSRGDFFNAANWEVDLAGLAVTADLAGLAVSGGLLKSGTAPNIEYLGMLLARFGVYGITIYGGYGEGVDEGERFVAFFAVGAVVGPIGGPPAFFLTGIGGGFGINRALVVPTDLSRFGDYPLIQALDIAAAPANPMDQLRSLGTFFPMERGTFWFAAGLSFNSFALVDGIAVVAVEVGDGLDVSLLGLARMALPRPQVALVSIEIALLVRFSSSEGVLWVQGQLTDNSWLLYPDVRLTGGFAFVTWFKGQYRGEFVLTLGGYHPDFNKPGYPQVPRLGLRWGIGDAIVVKAGSYFALTSEAVMAGGDFEASAEFGPAWAEVRFGAHGIVYFDPFRYKVLAYARISAGVTIDTWLFGEITISVSLGCRIEVEGPDFHGKATFEVGPVELTVEFGSTAQTRKELLAAGAFIDKYLERGPAGGARAIAVVVSSGAQPSGGKVPTPDGGPDRPFVVVAEFSLVLTSTVPATGARRTGDGVAVVPHQAPSRQLGVAPMGTGSITPVIELSWTRTGAAVPFPFVGTARTHGAFPVGVWGPPGDDDNRRTPKGDIVEALNELDLVARAVPSPGGPEIPYHQVEIGPRKPLPFTRRAIEATRVRTAGSGLAGLVPEPAGVDAAFVTAGRWLAASSSPTGLAALRGERQAPPRFGTLGEGLDALAESEVPEIGETPVRPGVDRAVYPPVAAGILAAAGTVEAAAPPRGTSVAGSTRMWRTPSPTFAAAELDRSRSIAAELVLVEAEAARSPRKRTVVATGDVPATAVAHATPAAVATHGGEGRGRLLGLTASLAAGRRAPAASGTPAATLAAGEIAVLRLPNADRDVGDGERPRLGVRGGPARLLAVANGGDVLADVDLGGEGQEEAWTVAPGTERLAVIALGDGAAREFGLAGWHGAMQMPYVGWSTALGARCTVRSLGEGIARHRERVNAGWLEGAELARGLSTVSTRFSLPVSTVLVVLDDPEALGGDVGGRRLVLGLDGATRATDAAGEERPPVVLTAENRSVLAYDVVPAQERGPVTVTVASEHGWSLTGVLGAVGTTAESAVIAIAARGLDAALRPLVPGSGGGVRLVWLKGEQPQRAPGPPARTATRAAGTRRSRKRGR